MSSEYEIRRQREDRVHRMGQQGPLPNVVYIDIENGGDLDGKILALLASKEKVVLDFADVEVKLFDHQKKLIDEATVQPFLSWVGARVQKKRPKSKEPKPFKSGLKINTVKGVIVHPIIGGPAFTFEEDDSYVACKVCQRETA